MAARRVMVLLIVSACSQQADKAPPPATDEPSQYELEARAIRESFRVVLADFHADVVAGRLEAAYARLAPMYRASVSLERFATIAKHPMFKDGVTFRVRGTSETAGTAKVQAFMQGPLGTSEVELRCTQFTGGWRIAGISVDGMPVLPSP